MNVFEEEEEVSEEGNTPTVDYVIRTIINHSRFEEFDYCTLDEIHLLAHLLEGEGVSLKDVSEILGCLRIISSFEALDARDIPDDIREVGETGFWDKILRILIKYKGDYSDPKDITDRDWWTEQINWWVTFSLREREGLTYEERRSAARETSPKLEEAKDRLTPEEYGKFQATIVEAADRLGQRYRKAKARLTPEQFVGWLEEGELHFPFDVEELYKSAEEKRLVRRVRTLISPGRKKAHREYSQSEERRLVELREKCAYGCQYHDTVDVGADDPLELLTCTIEPEKNPCPEYPENCCAHCEMQYYCRYLCSHFEGVVPTREKTHVESKPQKCESKSHRLMRRRY